MASGRGAHLRERRPTQVRDLNEVKWIKKIRAAVPKMPLWDVYVRTVQYLGAIEREDQELLRRLDGELAIRPWESPEQAAIWDKAFGSVVVAPRTAALKLTGHASTVSVSNNAVLKQRQKAPQSAGEVRRGKKTKR